MNRATTLETIMSGPQAPATPLIGRLLNAQEVDHVVGAYTYPQCYARQTGDHCEYIQNDGCGPYTQDCS